MTRPAKADGTTASALGVVRAGGPELMAAGGGVLGLFSGCTSQGGVQASGRLAWQAILAAGPAFGSPSLFCYGDVGPSETTEQAEVPLASAPERWVQRDAAPAGNAARQAFHTNSKGRAVLSALGRRRRAGVVLVWHIQLLKLLPLFRLPRARIVLFLHGIEAWRRRWPESLLLSGVDLFLSNSEYTWRRFVEANPGLAGAAYRIVPLGTGAPWEGSTPAPQSTPVALMVSRLAKNEDYKGHREMLDAWPLVQQRAPNAELWIAGDGDLRGELERVAADHGLGQAVRFLGRVSEQEKQSLIAQSRCLALPSRGEGFGLVYAESMRLGRPCLVSTVDAGREVVDPPRHGLAVDPADRPALAEALSRLLTDGPEWQRWSHLSRERYERHFTASQFQERFVSALLSARGGGR